MNKNFYQSLSLLFASTLFLIQTGCSTPVTTFNQQPQNTQSLVDNKNNTSTPLKIENSFLLTQKDSKGIVNPIVPEDIDSFTINGKIIKSSEIKIVKGSFAVKAETNQNNISLSFGMGKFTLSSTNISDVSFKLKNANNSVVIPNIDITKADGNLRVEVSRNSTGEVTGFIGGSDNNGLIDNSKSVFSLDLSAKTFTVIQPEGNKTEYSFNTSKSDIDQDSKKEETAANNEAQSLSSQVAKLSAAAPFVGNWKYSLLGIKVGLSIRDNGSGKIGYSSSIQSAKPVYKGLFNGIADYSSTSAVNSLDISSLINDKNIKGNIQLSGDNSLILVLNSTDETAVKNFVGIPVTLERDVQ